MKVLEPTYTMLDDVEQAVHTSATEAAALASSHEPNQAKWQEFIDERLVEWGRDPEQLADDGVIPPSKAAIDLACQLAMDMRDNGDPPPLRVVPNGDGGIVFERRAGAVLVEIEVNADRSIEFLFYENARLRARQRVESMSRPS